MRYLTSITLMALTAQTNSYVVSDSSKMHNMLGIAAKMCSQMDPTNYPMICAQMASHVGAQGLYAEQAEMYEDSETLPVSNEHDSHEKRVFNSRNFRQLAEMLSKRSVGGSHDIRRLKNEYFYLPEFNSNQHYSVEDANRQEMAVQALGYELMGNMM